MKSGSDKWKLMLLPLQVDLHYMYGPIKTEL